MKSIWKMAFLSTVFVLASCKGGGGGATTASGSSADPNTISGVAATGAPIVNGSVEVKGANGSIARTTTDSTGSYHVGVTSLTEPFLVRVLTPSGQKYISVASKDDLESGKKINVTPLTHVIVANVFHETNADTVFENFQTEASEFTKEKLAEEKNNLLEKFKSAGLAGVGGIVSANVDLLNGAIVAGSSSGVDALLDVLDVKTDASASTGIEIKIKGDSTPIITDKVDGVTTDPVVTPVAQSQLNSAQAQLSVIDKIKTSLRSFSAKYSSNLVCNGPVQTGGLCDKNALKDSLGEYFHTQFKDDGRSNYWSWFCNSSSGDSAVSESDCQEIEFANVSFQDVSLLSYDDTTKIATTLVNVYVDGELDTADDELRFKLDNSTNTFKLIGNGKTFAYWINSQSRHSTTYNTTSRSADDQYGMGVNFYFEDKGEHNFTGDIKFTMSSVSGHNIFPDNSNTMDLYLVPSPQWGVGGMDCSATVYRFSLSNKVFVSRDPMTQVETKKTFAELCSAQQSICECLNANQNYYYGGNYDGGILSLSDEQILSMDKREKIRLQSVPGSDVAIDETFYLTKPLQINALNASSYIPSFGRTAEQLCTAEAGASYELSAPWGFLGYARVHHGYVQDDQWVNSSANKNFVWSDFVKNYLYTPAFDVLIPDGTQILSSHYYLYSSDEFDRQFVRTISCE